MLEFWKSKIFWTGVIDLVVSLITLVVGTHFAVQKEFIIGVVTIFQGFAVMFVNKFVKDELIAQVKIMTAKLQQIINNYTINIKK